MYKSLIIIIAFFLFSGFVSAQMADQAEIKNISETHNGLNPVSKPFSLVDFSRIKWSHSYSVTYFSGGGSTGSMGIYYGDIFYEISSKLSLDVRIGIAHDPGSLFNNTVNNDAQLFPAFRLDYHPGNNFHLSIGFARYPGTSLNPYGYSDSENYWRYLNR